MNTMRSIAKINELLQFGGGSGFGDLCEEHACKSVEVMR